MAKAVISLFVLLLAAGPGFAQRPENPALLMAEPAPELDYVAVPNGLSLPPGMKMGAPAAVQFDKQGHLFLLTRGAVAVLEFDENGKYIRGFGERRARAHGLRIDSDGNLWVTDVAAHTVEKFDPQGKVLLTLGVKGKAGLWDEASGTHLLNEPTDVAFGRNGTFFVAQGHIVGDDYSYILKFDKNGNFIKKWGGKGAGPGKLEVAHGIAMDPKGNLWVADRDNQRLQVFDQDGKYIREIHYTGLPSSLCFAPNNIIYMVNGFAGQLLKLDKDGNVLAAVGRPGKGLGEFGEAHFITMSPKGDIYVADTANGALQKFVKTTAEN